MGCRKYFDRIFIDGLSGMACRDYLATVDHRNHHSADWHADWRFYRRYDLCDRKGSCVVDRSGHRYCVPLSSDSQLVVVSSATAGMVGAFASKLLAGTVLVEGTMVYAGPGEPLGAFLAAYVGIELDS